MRNSLLYQICEFEFFVVELLWLYFPLRWCSWACILLFIPEGSSLEVPDMCRVWKNRFRIVSRLHDYQNPDVQKVSIMANLDQAGRDRAAPLFELWKPLEVLDHLVLEYY